MSAWYRAPSLPVAVLLAIAPAMAVAQFRALAPAVTLAFVLTIIAHWRAHRALPWPAPRPATLLAAALLGWCALSALWSSEGPRALLSTASLAALLLLGAMAARAVAADGAPNLRRLGVALFGGLALGAALLAFDQASGHLFRLAVRGFPRDMPFIGFGIKPALSFFVLLLPLALAVPGLALVWRLLLVAAGLAVARFVPADAAALAALAGMLAAGFGALLPRLARRLLALGLAGFFLAAPLLFGQVMARAPDLSALPFSAQHRVLIWDFVLQRIAERPLLGWGMEASRAIPGGAETFAPETLDRFGLTEPAERNLYNRAAVQRLPLHTHNAALQVHLELGLLGAVMAAALAGAILLAAGGSAIPAAALGVAASAAVTGQLSFGAWQAWWIAAMLLAAVTIAGLSALREQTQQRG
jgi:O-antigen ligase